MTIVELKAKAYDVLAQIEYLQRVLAEVNVQIQKQTQEETAAPEAELTAVD